MAKKAMAGGEKPKAKKAKPAKQAKSGSASKAGKKEKKSKASSSTGAADVIFKLAEHPIVAELIAVGATAAVAAIAKGTTDRSGRGNTRAVKDAGKAAAAAIGARLVEEFKAVKKSAEDKAKKA
ncbi:hypothetical protein G7076_08020 [Sphingomonas sp. HDW15A]|uniref:hypothetical protein n=1 Tax=Sphingomonas sp. HDW15A TaxID=2714942 RepID=UPI00140CA493|nr:hypothetical protein [Sphingomonas sp. HDW15A]QIK96395.1 hypothetical protein G7076_08020 [Sphingomonas sp. HDW15A]